MTARRQLLTQPGLKTAVFFAAAVWMRTAHAERGHSHAESPAKPTAMAPMHMTEPLGIPMARDGSGTAWQPDSTPMRGIHAMLGGFQLMFHENISVGYDAFGSNRGDDRFVSTNWFMVMAHHDLGSGQIGARLMLSAEPLTVGGRGYPLLLQTGETWRGVPLHDHQHPHDLFMEAAIEYKVPLNDSVGIDVYVAPAGEPAVGPVAFPHRESARSDPLAAIGHHWQDSTHISFGVLTLGVFTRQFKLEGSWFNGREPDEKRYDFDLRAPDSFAARLSFNPMDDLSLQASWAYLKSPEQLEPDTSLHRATASVTLNTPVFATGNWASTLATGVNFVSGEKATQSSLVETNFDLDLHHTFFGRVEFATKTGRDLVLAPEQASTVYTMAALNTGYVFNFSPVAHFVPGLGVRGSVDVLGAELGSVYGNRTPVGGMVFFQLHPETMDMAGEAM